MRQARPERPPSLLDRRVLGTNPATVTVEYRGKGPLVVTGPTTNRSYAFTRFGQRVMMDARDRDLTRTFTSLRLIPDP
ncbi:MAG TPA: hypothetical protein VIV60_32235 [Polyangiaceae bacterium]